MDKCTETMAAFKIPPKLKEKISRSARKNLRSINQQLIYDLCLAEHIQNFSLEEDLSINFFDCAVKKVNNT